MKSYLPRSNPPYENLSDEALARLHRKFEKQAIETRKVLVKRGYKPEYDFINSSVKFTKQETITTTTTKEI